MVVCSAAGTGSDKPMSSAAIEAVAMIFVFTVSPPVPEHVPAIDPTCRRNYS
jgi:hypothetical protein